MEDNQKSNPNKISEQLEDIKSDFITIASHQLRTPISGIRWSLDTILAGKAGKLSDKQRSIIQEAYQNNNFMVKVVNDLLRASRIEEKGIQLVVQPTNLVKIVKEAIKKFNNFTKACNCEINLKIKSFILPKAYIDPLQIKPVLEGLIDNAIRYSKSKGNIKITLKEIKGFLLFKIEDNGIGIPTDQQSLVFSKFFRARNAIKIQSEGLGLDLFIAKKIVEASGGKIKFTSTEDKGTAFFVYLPTRSKKSEIKLSSEQPEKGVNDLLRKEREFVSVTVHELKAPLGITKWSLEMLRGGKPGKINKNQLELIDQIYRGNERLLILVRDLLDLAKLQEGKFDVKPSAIKLETVIKDVATGFKVEAEKKKLRLAIPKFNGQLPKISGDPNRVAQVITNLVSNAVKYTPERGKIIIEIKNLSGPRLRRLGKKIATANILNTNNKKGYLVLAVKDTGMGISKEEQKKLFTRFFRGKSVLKSKAEGTGLGLYITKTIVELHKGDIWFTSQPGKGSTFYFSLPII